MLVENVQSSTKALEGGREGETAVCVAGKERRPVLTASWSQGVSHGEEEAFCHCDLIPLQWTAHGRFEAGK